MEDAAAKAATPAAPAAAAAAAEGVASIRDGVMNNDNNQKQQHDSRNRGSGTGPIAPSSAAAIASRGGATPLDPEAQQAVRKERRDRAREAKLAHSKSKDNSAQHQQKKKGEGSKRRWGNGRRGKGKRKTQNGDGEAKTPDLFDEWLGVRLATWKGEGEAAAGVAAVATPAQGGGGGGGGLSARPPEGSGIDEEIDFDPSKDEIGARARLFVLFPFDIVFRLGVAYGLSGKGALLCSCLRLWNAEWCAHRLCVPTSAGNTIQYRHMLSFSRCCGRPPHSLMLNHLRLELFVCFALPERTISIKPWWPHQQQ